MGLVHLLTSLTFCPVSKQSMIFKVKEVKSYTIPLIIDTQSSESRMVRTGVVTPQRRSVIKKLITDQGQIWEILLISSSPMRWTQINP